VRPRVPPPHDGGGVRENRPLRRPQGRGAVVVRCCMIWVCEEAPCETRPPRVKHPGWIGPPLEEVLDASNLFPRLESKPFIRGAFYSASSFAAGPRGTIRMLDFGV